MDAEVELLVRCADLAIDDDDDRIRSLLSADLDWERVFDLGRGHGVLPILNRTLGSRFADEIPGTVISTLEKRTRSTALRNLRLGDELHAIADVFDDAGIRWLPFKGPVLAQAAYGDIGLREFKDLDVLVHRDDASQAVDLLETLGYELAIDGPRLDDSPLLGGPFTKPLLTEYTLWRGDTEVELRCSVGQADRPFSPAFQTLWSRRETVDVAGRELPALCPADRLLVLAFHGTKHNWHLLKWVCDFQAAVLASEIDWPWLFDRARDHETERKLRLGLALIETLFDSEAARGCPANGERDERVAELTERVIESMGHGLPTRPSKRDRFVFNAKASDSFRDCLSLLLGFSNLRPKILEYRLLPLPGVFHPLYYLVSPLRAVGVGCVRSAGFRQ